MTPTVGRLVHYTITAANAEATNKRRNDATRSMADHRENANGVQVHFGNVAREGDVYPLLIVRVWPDDLVNGQAFLDGNDSLWVTSASSRWPRLHTRCSGSKPSSSPVARCPRSHAPRSPAGMSWLQRRHVHGSRAMCAHHRAMAAR